MNVAGRFSTAVVLLLIAAYAVPGLIGHDLHSLVYRALLQLVGDAALRLVQRLKASILLFDHLDDMKPEFCPHGFTDFSGVQRECGGSEFGIDSLA